MVLFVNVKESANIGDTSCSPYLYFKQYYQNAIHVDISKHEPKKDDIVIIGGGGLFHDGIDEMVKKYIICRKKIIWGAGMNYHGSKTYNNEKINFLNEFDLVGMRDVHKCNKNFVPCCSCMSNLFDRQYIVQDDVRVYEHAYNPINLNYPKINNFFQSFEEKISFLASANKIITNSYHGLYWSILLGKMAVVYKPFSNRFLFTGLDIKFCDETNYKFALKNTVKYNVLEKYRNINQNFNKMALRTLC